MRKLSVSSAFFVLAFSFQFLSSPVYANNYYVDPSFGGSPTGSFTNPWTSIPTVNAEQWRFAGGDTIFFKRGEHFLGKLDIWTSGTAVAPIVFMPYGSGNAPVFEYNMADGGSVINRQVIVTSNSNYLVFDGLELTDTTMSVSDHTILANVGRGIYLYQSSNIIVRNLNISRIGIGVTIEGNNNTVTGCTIGNLREIINTAAPTWDDFGAIGILIAGNNNSILSNHISECWAPSFDYTYDGGAVEFQGGSSGNVVQYNTAINNDGWLQVNSTGSTATGSDNLIAYNLLINNGRVMWFNFGGTLTVQNYQFFNNDIIETVLQHSNYPYMFGCDIAPTNAVALVLKNNIFWINTSIDLTYTVTQPWEGPQMVHQNNIYHLSGGSLGYTIDASDSMLAPATTVFTNTSNADPALWDYHVPTSSPAYEFGQILGLTRDFAGNPVPVSNPEAGIYENIMLTLSSSVFSLQGTKVKEYNSLRWQFINERTPGSFVIEKSNDGIRFSSIGTIRPSLATGSGNFTDSTCGTRGAYYRIRAVMTSGEIFQSKVIYLDGRNAMGKLLNLYPNPVATSTKLFTGDDLYRKNVTVVDGVGRVVSQFRITEHTTIVEIQMGHLPAGLYYIGISDDNGKFAHTTAIKKD